MSSSDLQLLISQALVREHPEWVLPDGQSPMLESYLSRFAELIGDQCGVQEKKALHEMALAA